MNEETTVRIETPDGVMDGWRVTPVRPPRAAVILCPEIFGITAHTRKIARSIASRGYAVLALNLFYRSAPGVGLANDDAGRARGLALLNEVQRDSVLTDLNSAISYLKAGQKPELAVSVVGISSGGHVAYLAACKLDIQLGVSFYGGWIAATDIPLSRPEPTVELTAEMAQRDVRFLYFVGARDFLITSEQTTRIQRALSNSGVRHDVTIYPNAGHAFLSEEPEIHDAIASADAWRRTYAALEEELTRGATKRK